MRAQFVLSEIGVGLRRNLTMTFAVVVSVALSVVALRFRRTYAPGQLTLGLGFPLRSRGDDGAADALEAQVEAAVSRTAVATQPIKWRLRRKRLIRLLPH